MQQPVSRRRQKNWTQLEHVFHEAIFDYFEPPNDFIIVSRMNSKHFFLLLALRFKRRL